MIISEPTSYGLLCVNDVATRVMTCRSEYHVTCRDDIENITQQCDRLMRRRFTTCHHDMGNRKIHKQCDRLARRRLTTCHHDISNIKSITNQTKTHRNVQPWQSRTNVCPWHHHHAVQFVQAFWDCAAQIQSPRRQVVVEAVRILLETKAIDSNYVRCGFAACQNEFPVIRCHEATTGWCDDGHVTIGGSVSSQTVFHVVHVVTQQHVDKTAVVRQCRQLPRQRLGNANRLRHVVVCLLHREKGLLRCIHLQVAHENTNSCFLTTCTCAVTNTFACQWLSPHITSCNLEIGTWTL